MKKRIHRKNYTKAEYLPTFLVEKLRNTVFTDRSYKQTKNNFLLCVSVIHYHQVRNSIGTMNFIPLSRNYWKTVFGGNYHKSVLKPLLQEYKIIESHAFGSRNIPERNVKRGKQSGTVSIRYRIKPELLNDEFELIHYLPTGRLRTSEEICFADGQQFLIPDIPDKNFRISIDKPNAISWVEKNAERICDDMLNQEFVNAVPDTLLIQCHELINKSGKWSFTLKYQSVKSAKLRAETQGKQLFYFNTDFCIADVDEFLRQRIESLKYNYKQHISKIGLQNVEEKQNPKTLRVYSDLTSFPSRLLPFININNKTVVQLDLRTSQFLLFANLLNTYIKSGEQGLLKPFHKEITRSYLKNLAVILKRYHRQLPKVGVENNDCKSADESSSDVTKFIREVFFMDFYTVVQHELGFSHRMLAKHTMFKLLFKKTSKPDALLNMLKERYPVVMGIIADFKSQETQKKSNNTNQESDFSVFLSCIEGEIYVNNILQRLREAKIPCFTRHDSMVVASGYQQEAETIAKQVFAEFGFRYNSKEDELFWKSVDNEKLYSSDFMQWHIDETELNQEFIYENLNKEPDDDEINTDIMSERHQTTLNRLSEIGERQDYYGYFDAEFLEEIAQLPFLNQYHCNIFYDEANNQNDDMPFFQDETNDLIRRIIEYYC